MTAAPPAALAVLKTLIAGARGVDLAGSHPIAVPRSQLNTSAGVISAADSDPSYRNPIGSDSGPDNNPFDITVTIYAAPAAAQAAFKKTFSSGVAPVNGVIFDANIVCGPIEVNVTSGDFSSNADAVSLRDQSGVLLGSYGACTNRFATAG
jgi:hypothetical protein